MLVTSFSDINVSVNSMPNVNFQNGPKCNKLSKNLKKIVNKSGSLSKMKIFISKSLEIISYIFLVVSQKNLYSGAEGKHLLTSPASEKKEIRDYAASFS